MGKLRILFLGPAGAGKGTQSAKLAVHLGIEHISTGDLIRNEIQSRSALGEKVKAIVESGQLVSDDIVNEIVKGKLKLLDRFILDGYPRTLDQAEFLDDISGGLDYVFDLKVNKEELFKRLTGRRICSKKNDPNCKNTFHVIYNPPKKEGLCDLCGSEIYQRKDDKEDVIEKRLRSYEQETGKPLTEYYTKQKKLTAINALRSPDQVFNDIVKLLSPSLHETQGTVKQNR